MNLDNLMKEMLPEIEETLEEMVYRRVPVQYKGIIEMMAYHMGWSDATKKNMGKRIRPVIVLLATKLCNGEWQKALPAAAAIELLHNFSLIHDDIEDLSETRHGQSTLWKKYGLAQAINSGDAMFSLAQICILELGKTISPEVAYESSKLVNNTCLFLTGGQYLDMTFEDSLDTSSDDYFQMISGKTAALLAASAELGALVSQSSKINRNNLRAFGEALGLAFQAQDDFLGIWGDEAIIGKSTSSDLKSGKKTLPVVYALEKDPSLLAYFKEKPESDFQVRERVAILEKMGAKQYTEKVAKHYNDLASQSLDAVTDGNLEAKQALLELINFLLNRAK